MLHTVGLLHPQDYGKSRINTALLQLIKIGLLGILVQHLLACAWYTIGLREVAEGKASWIEADYILLRTPLSDIGSRYIRSLYWVVCTVNGNGLGDIVPLGTSVLETAFAISFLVSGSVRAPLAPSM